MIEIYRRFPSYMGTTLTAVVERLLAGGAPMLVHCSAGKDRTGFVIAMLLHALDVPEPLIREDYLASRHWPGASPPPGVARRAARALHACVRSSLPRSTP